jgi:transposase-like protein
VGDLPDEVRERLSDELLTGARSVQEIVGPGGLLADLTRRLVERAMDAELTQHLGYEPPGGTGNTRNGGTPKTLHTEHGSVQIKTPRDRDGSFEPQIVRKGQRRFQGFDEKIIALYARGMSVRDIEAHLAELYGVQVGHDLISRVTDTVMDDVRAWQQRPLEDVYPIVFLDALVIKVREGGTVQRRACYLALGVTLDGERDVLRDVVSGERWREVLAPSPHRPQAARRQGHPDRLCRRAEGLPRRDRGRLPERLGADVHCSLCRRPGYAEVAAKGLQSRRCGALMSA